MAEGKNIKNVFESVRYRFNDNYGLTYIDQETYNNIMHELGAFKMSGEINYREHDLLSKITKHHYQNSILIKQLDAEHPRLIAQKFIGRKKVREFIFKRDNHTCLRCSSKDNLSVDHIVSVRCGGENKIGNLQTLCRSCNSKKGEAYADYRNG